MQTEPAGKTPRERLFQLVPFGLVVAYVSLLIATFFMGIWLVGADGRPKATDFVSFWAAGKLVLSGHAADAYDWTIHKSMEIRAVGHGFDTGSPGARLRQNRRNG